MVEGDSGRQLHTNLCIDMVTPHLSATNHLKPEVGVRLGKANLAGMPQRIPILME